MNAKRLMAILITLMMLLALFSACAGTADGGGTQSDTGGNTAGTDADTPENTEGDTDDQPEAVDPTELSFLSFEAHGSYTLDACTDYTTYKDMTQHLLDNYNLTMDRTIVNETVYESTLNSYIAGNTLTDIFYTGYLSDDIVNNCVGQGLFADMDEVLAYSDGTAAGMFADGATFNFIKGMNVREDGHWYTCHTAASAYTNIDLDDEDTDFVCEFPISCFYDVQIRYDWLQKLGLAVPSTTQEYKDALIAMQENDCNENGAADERAFLCLGSGTDDVYVGIGGWFGLTNGNFIVSVADGSVQSAILQGDQYIQFANYMNELYDAGVVLNGEGSMWNRSVEVAANCVSSYQQYPSSTYYETTTGVESFYYPSSVIQAIDGVKPTIQGQASVVGYTAYGFDANSDYAACAAWMDFIHSEYYFLMLYFGVEGHAWDWQDDGTILKYNLTEDEALDYNGMWTYMTWTAFPQIDTSIVYHYNAVTYDSIQSALDNGEPYTKDGYASYEEFLENPANAAKHFTDEGDNWFCFFNDLIEFGVENIDWTCAATFKAAYTNEEIDTIGMYETDIKTYFDELNVSYIIGSKSTGTYDEDIQFAYDNLHLQEYINSIQSASNRYLEAVGREPIPIA